MKKLGLAVAAVLAAAAMSVAYAAWRALADVTMSTAGYIAMILGALVTVAFGVGLMFLVFWSNRHGFDDRAGSPHRLEGREPSDKS